MPTRKRQPRSRGDAETSQRTNGTLAADASEADAAEQSREVIEHDDEAPTSIRDDVDPADATEQHREVSYDEDEYR